MPTCDYCIYILLDPRDGRVRYVGYTRCEAIRKRQHELLGPSEARRYGHTAYVQWKQGLLTAGLVPIFRIIERGDVTSSREGYWIRYFNKKNQPLTNAKIPHYRWLTAWKKRQRYKGTPMQGKVKASDVFDMRYFESADR